MDKMENGCRYSKLQMNSLLSALLDNFPTFLLKKQSDGVVDRSENSSEDNLTKDLSNGRFGRKCCFWSHRSIQWFSAALVDGWERSFAVGD